MPKSSSAIITPISLSALSATSARSLSRRNTLSVTSSVTTPGAVSVFPRTAGHCRREVGRHQLVRGDVHRDVEAERIVVARPLPAVQARLLQHPASDLGDEARPFRERHRSLRADDPVHRVCPAQQCLDAGDPPVGRCHDRLVLRAQLPALQRAAEIAIQRGAMVREALLAESTVAWRAPPFRLAWYIAVSATCSSLLGSLVAAAGERDTHARAHLHVDLRQREGLAERGADPCRERAAL